MHSSSICFCFLQRASLSLASRSWKGNPCFSFFSFILFGLLSKHFCWGDCFGFVLGPVPTTILQFLVDFPWTNQLPLISQFLVCLKLPASECLSDCSHCVTLFLGSVPVSNCCWLILLKCRFSMIFLGPGYQVGANSENHREWHECFEWQLSQACELP